MVNIDWQPFQGAGNIIFTIIKVIVQTLFILGGLKCEELVKYVVKVTNKGPSTCFSKISEQSVPILVKFSVFKLVIFS